MFAFQSYLLFIIEINVKASFPMEDEGFIFYFRTNFLFLNEQEIK